MWAKVLKSVGYWLASFMILLLTASGAQAQNARPECFVELPVFDSGGNSVPYEIVALRSEDPTVNRIAEESVVVGTRAYFPKRLLFRGVLEIALKDRKARVVRQGLLLSSCQQRTSLEFEDRDTGADVSGASIVGRTSGCPGDSLWVRAMPMFGGQTSNGVHEGFIGADGAFSLTSGMRGERHILIIGRGKHPLKAIGVDVTSGGGKTDVGEIDLRNECRQP
jgi:hypothetical protein